jgi:hypothetical protein
MTTEQTTRALRGRASFVLLAKALNKTFDLFEELVDHHFGHTV